MAGVCPPGYILRKGYTRKFRNTTKKEGYLVHKFGKVYTVKPKKNVTYVSSACIKNRGLPGKGPREGEGFASLRKGELIKYGYSYRLSNTVRRKALEKAIKAYGALPVYRKLDAVAKLSMRTAPEAHKVFVADRDWIQHNYELKKNE
jgi:hypothetical protein